MTWDEFWEGVVFTETSNFGDCNTEEFCETEVDKDEEHRIQCNIYDSALGI